MFWRIFLTKSAVGKHGFCIDFRRFYLYEQTIAHFTVFDLTTTKDSRTYQLPNLLICHFFKHLGKSSPIDWSPERSCGLCHNCGVARFAPQHRSNGSAQEIGIWLSSAPLLLKHEMGPQTLHTTPASEPNATLVLNPNPKANDRHHQHSINVLLGYFIV